MSCRPFLCIWNMYHYQQRCVYKKSSPNLEPKNLHHPSLCVFKIFHAHHPFWRRYTFLRVRLRNRRFLPHPYKNWSPLRSACVCLYIYHAYINNSTNQQCRPYKISFSNLKPFIKFLSLSPPHSAIYQFRKSIFTVICDDNLMRNGCMKCFWSETYWQVRRSDENTESTVYRKLARK